MSTYFIRDLLIEFESSGLPANVIQDLCNAVHMVGAKHGIAPPESYLRLIYARELMDQHTPQPTISKMLIERFGVARRTSYRDISAAFAIAPYSVIPIPHFEKDSYVRNAYLRNIPAALVPPDLIDACRFKIKINRLLKERVI